MRFVLVHGACHGAWCWERVVPLLSATGHDVVAVDLPGRGAQPARVRDRTLDSYAAAVVDALAPQAPSVLVGHSMGGVAIARAAELVPERVAHLVFVAAILPAPGQSMFELAGPDEDSLASAHTVIDRALFRLEPAAVRAALYQDLSDDDARAAEARLVDEAVAPTMAPVEWTAERFGRVPRSYVMTLRDRTISPALQRRMIGATPCARVVELDTGHSPFYAAPAELARALVSVSSAPSARVAS